MPSPKSARRRGDEEYMALSCQWNKDEEEVSSSSDEESNLASSVDYEQQCLRRKGRTHTRDRLGAWRLSNPEMIQQIGAPGGTKKTSSSRRSSGGGSHRKGRKSMSRKSKSKSMSRGE